MRTIPVALQGLQKVVALVLIATGFAACDRRPTTTYQAAAHRLITEPTDEILDLKALRRSYGFTRQSFDDIDQLRLWRTRDAAERVVEDGLFKVRSSGQGLPFIRLSHEIEFFAEDVREIVVVASGLKRRRMRLSWAIPGEGFVAARQLLLAAGGAQEVAYRFKVAEHPAWRGRIRALRLDLPNIAGQEVGIRSFETRGREGYEAEMLARIVGQDWKVVFGNEARNAVVTPPDVPRRWQLSEPTTGRLRFAYGLPPDLSAPAARSSRRLPAAHQPEAARSIQFRVVAEDGTSLFEDAVDPSDARRAGRWHEGEIELAESTGALIFETSAPADYRLEAGLPAWATPEVITPLAGERRPNVILISIDTLRADRLGIYGYQEPTSPNIDRWARSRAVTFKRAVATAPWTLPSHVSMLSGLDALRHGVNHHLPAPRELDLLAEMLRRAGYLTAAVTGGGWLHPNQGLAQGFDIFRFWGGGTAGHNELKAGLARALELLEVGRERELFLFFHTYEAHDPFRRRLPWAEQCPASTDEAGQPLALLYGAVEEERKQHEGFPLRYGFRKWRPGQSAVADGVPLTDAELPLVSCLYDSGIAYVDQHLGQFFERLEALDPDRRTLVILTSDHGESLGEYGYVKHAYLYDSNLLVPLVVALPGGDHGGETIETQVSSVDLVPTVLEAVGLETPAGLDGESLLSLIAGRSGPGSRQAWSYAGASNFGLSLRLDDRAKYVYNNTAWVPLGGAEELYDLRSDADERHDQSTESPERLEPLRARVVEYLQNHGHGVRVEIENRGCGELTGVVTGLPVHISRVKAAQPPGERFTWLGKRRGGFRLAAGESLDLLLEAARGTVTVEGTLDPCGEFGPGEASGDAEGGRAFKQPLDLDRLETWELVFDGSVWREGPIPSAGAQARVVARREGRGVAEPGASQELDPALVEQLKALGYLGDG